MLAFKPQTPVNHPEESIPHALKTLLDTFNICVAQVITR
jgi:hypothetical protein